jgi:hypothetical protein
VFLSSGKQSLFVNGLGAKASRGESFMMAGRISQSRRSERLVTVTAVMFVASMATLMRSFLGIKLFFLTLFLLAFLVNIYLRRTRIVVYRRLVWFYLWIGVAGIVWAIVGLLHPSNYVQAVFDDLRLYVVWSAAFLVLYTLLRAAPSLNIMHNAMVIAGILIPLINFVGLYDQFSGSGLISEGIRQELNLEIGFGEGHIEIASENIIAMFVIAPYLLSLQFRADAGKSNSLSTKLALVLSLIFVALSGRRALWLVVALTPCTILLLSSLTGSCGLMKAGGRRFLLACAAGSVVGLGTLLILPESAVDVASITRLKQAFSSEDERTIQMPYLINAFMKSPVLGSGFGGHAGYIRSDERPWSYELTYYQMLLNLGVVGVTVLVVLFSLYFVTVIRLLREFKDGSAIPFGLLIAFFSILAGAYSNPYFGGFDSLFFAGLLPFLSTFQHGFEQPKLTAGAAL